MILLVIVISSPPALRFAVEHPRLDMGLFGGAAVALFVYGLVHRSVSIPRYLLTNVVGLVVVCGGAWLFTFAFMWTLGRFSK
jgi:hypothetical protein